MKPGLNIIDNSSNEYQLGEVLRGLVRVMNYKKAMGFVLKLKKRY